MKIKKSNFNKVFYIWLVGILATVSVFVFKPKTSAETTHAQSWAIVADNFSFEGEGTSTEPYLISAPEQLATISKHFQNYYNKHIRLANNISLSGYEWVPLGSPSLKFNGVFDGGGFSIFGLSISSKSNLTYAGLFGVVGTGTIKNLIFEDVLNSYVVSKNTTAYAGALAGLVENGTVENVSNMGVLTMSIATSQDSFCGGLVGRFGTNSNIAIKKATNNQNVYSYSAQGASYAGGIVGAGGGYIENGLVKKGKFSVLNAANRGNVFSYSGAEKISFGGGIVSYVYDTGLIESSFNAGKVETGQRSTKNINLDGASYTAVANSSSYGGGILGYTGNSKFALLNIYNTGDISSFSKSETNSYTASAGSTTNMDYKVEGGFYLLYSWQRRAKVFNYDKTGKNKETLVWENTYSLAYAGGIVGRMTGTVTNAYSSGNIVGGAEKTKYKIAQTLNNNFTNSLFANENDYLVQYLTLEWSTNVYYGAINGHRSAGTTRAYTSNDYFDYNVTGLLNSYQSTDSKNPTKHAGSTTTITVKDKATGYITGAKTSFSYFSNICASITRNKGSITFYLSYTVPKLNNLAFYSMHVVGGSQQKQFDCKRCKPVDSINLDPNFWEKYTFINGGKPVLKDFYW